MSLQNGIKANDNLKKNFGICYKGKVRALKIIIDNEELALKNKIDCIGTWDKDFDNVVRSFIEEDQPCFILYRLDTKNTLGYEWLLITWSPDTAVVKQKMLYASTKSTLKLEFGTTYLKDELFCTTKEEATLVGYKNHLSVDSTPAPLTDREEALKNLSIQDHSVFSPDTRQQTLSGITFPMTNNAQKALIDMANGHYDYLQFKIDIDEEKIHLDKYVGELSVGDLPKQVPTDQARYHLFLFKHTHEGDHLETIVFIYSMPGYTCSIKERMMYSSCKGPFLESIERAGIEVVKKIEIDDGKELTEEFLQDEVHPKRNIHRQAFAKPKGPPNRGAKRITKTQPAQ